MYGSWDQAPGCRQESVYEGQSENVDPQVEVDADVEQSVAVGQQANVVKNNGAQL